MRRTRPVLLATLLALSTSACAQTDPAAEREIPAFVVPAVRPDVTYVRVLAIGDHGHGDRGQRSVADAMAKRAAKEPADFILTLGDNIYGHGVKSVDDPLWKTRYADHYTAKSLQIPWRPSLGNHDHKGNVQAQIDYSKKNPLWQMPARYYTYKKELGGKKHVQFFAIDSDVLGAADPEQAVWLETELAASTATWKIVYGHHPLYSHSKRPYNLRMIRHLEPLLTKHKVDLYIAGHDHMLEMLKPIRGVHYAVSGNGGGAEHSYPAYWTDKSYYAATRGGFVYLRISAAELVLEFCRLDGETQFAHTLFKGRSGPF